MAATPPRMSRKVVGIDLGGTKLLGGVVDEQLEVHDRVHQLVEGLSESALVEAIVECATELIERHPDVQAVGFGIPCLLDQRDGTAVMCVNVPLSNIPFRDIMSERLGLPVFIDNDANVATLVEQRFGAARGADFVVGLTIGTGIGGGLIIEGKLYRGHAGSGAELGHMVIDENGPRCQGTCPNYGCLEAMASGTAIGREGKIAAEEDSDSDLARAAVAGEEITGELVTQLALGGDEVSRMVLGHIGRQLGIGFANFVNIFNPEVIVVGGGAMAAGDLLLDPAREEMRARALRPNREQVRVMPARFGPEAGMLGAGVLALDELD
ncbi:MAG TPA: ROK family protein [Solirubrobacterales bacterium]|nr:ROK family protein [Solirubrobacterales bacterium]